MKLGNTAFGSKEAIVVLSFIFPPFEVPFLKLAGWGLHSFHNDSTRFKTPAGLIDTGSQALVWGGAGEGRIVSFTLFMPLVLLQLKI